MGWALSPVHYCEARSTGIYTNTWILLLSENPKIVASVLPELSETFELYDS